MQKLIVLAVTYGILSLTQVSLRANAIQVESDFRSQIRTQSHEINDLAKSEVKVQIDALSTMHRVTRDDPDLNSFLVPPASEPLKLKKPDTQFYSQEGQHSWALKALGARENLFVVESGAYDGETFSNSLFFEKEKRTSCLLVEPNPVLQEQILQKRRHCHLLKGGISITNGTSSFDFELAGPLGGIKDSLGYEQGRIDKEKSEDKPWTQGADFSGKTIKVQCFPLASVMQHLGRSTIDYWSLDVEGAEFAVLSHTDFNKIEVGVMSIEHGSPGSQDKILSVMTSHGFKRVKATNQDDYYANPKYFAKRGLPFPEHS